jgi:hypothetical protein
MACGMAAALTVVTVALKEPWHTSLLSCIPCGGMCSWWEHPLRKRQQESCFHNCAMAWIWWALVFKSSGVWSRCMRRVLKWTYCFCMDFPHNAHHVLLFF